jgi:hypothetical protein
MVIKNARLSLKGLSVGNWNDRADAEPVSIMIVETFEACIMILSKMVWRQGSKG